MCHETLQPDNRWPNHGPQPQVWRSEVVCNVSWRFFIAAVVLIAAAAWVFAQHVPCEQQGNVPRQTKEPPLAATVIQTGDVTTAVALSNRLAIETGSQLPASGVVQLDQALTVKSGMTLDGGTFRNAFKGDNFPRNCSAEGGGTGIGYVDKLTWLRPTRCQFLDGNAAENYKPGAVAFFFRYDGYNTTKYPDRFGQLCSRRTIATNFYGGLTLTAAVDPRCDSAKWFASAAPIIQDVRPGQTSVSVPSEGHATIFRPGDYVTVTAGPALANADTCEFNRVVGIQNVSIQLATPTQRAYRTPVVAKVQPVANVTLRNVTIEAPVNPAANALFLRYVTGLTLDNVTVNGHLGMASCWNCTLRNCTVTGELGVGASSHGLTLINCNIRRLAMEEGVFDVLAVGCTFGPHAVPLQSSVGCERMTFRSCRVTGATVFPVSLACPDLTVDDMLIDGSVGLLQSWFAGDRLKLRKLRSDTATTFFGGNGISVEDVQSTQSNLGWIDGQSQSQGIAIDVTNALIRQGTWRVVP